MQKEKWQLKYLMTTVKSKQDKPLQTGCNLYCLIQNQSKRNACFFYACYKMKYITQYHYIALTQQNSYTFSPTTISRHFVSYLTAFTHFVALRSFICKICFLVIVLFKSYHDSGAIVHPLQGEQKIKRHHDELHHLQPGCYQEAERLLSPYTTVTCIRSEASIIQWSLNILTCGLLFLSARILSMP